jgi:hypothetical protein
MEILQ